MSSTTLTDLPPELLDRVIDFVQTARSVTNLGSTSKTLQAFVEKDAWKRFVFARFPSICPSEAPSFKDVARTLTTLSKAWDRRAFVAKYIEPHGNIYSFEHKQQVNRWRRPRGQTLGFTPQLDCFEESGALRSTKTEILAFSAGAELCIRHKSTRNGNHLQYEWKVYRPPDALEGRDDVTSLHLLRPQSGDENANEVLQLITGTANGDLRLLKLANNESGDVPQSNFVTSGQPVRSSSVLQQNDDSTLLAAIVGDARILLYKAHTDLSTIEPSNSTEIQVQMNGQRNYRAWTTRFLSSSHLAVGLGPCSYPVQIYGITSSGIESEPLRKFSLQRDSDHLEIEDGAPGRMKKTSSSIYPIIPLPPATHGMAGASGQVFLSGAYDGIIRLHDLRSPRDNEQMYEDPTDSAAIYSLLPRGQETLVAGTSRHSLLKVFDMRLGAKAYSYINANGFDLREQTNPKDWNLFLKPHGATYPGRGGGNNWARRSAESSIYSLASPSHSSPFVYAGIENAVLELGFTSVLDHHPDPIFSPTSNRARSGDVVNGFRSQEILDLAMYDHTADMMKLRTQRSLWETFRMRGEQTSDRRPDLDERWKLVSS